MSEFIKWKLGKRSQTAMFLAASRLPEGQSLVQLNPEWTDA
jgi:hypothetical protein